jgi:hypothetical protein
MIKSFDGTLKDNQHHQSQTMNHSPSRRQTQNSKENPEHHVHHKTSKDELMKDLRANIVKLYSLIKP